MKSNTFISNTIGWIFIVATIGSGLTYAFLQNKVAISTHDDHGHDDHGEENKVLLSDISIELGGIETEKASKNALKHSFELMGIITPNRNQMVSIKSRHPGLLTSVSASLGDSIRKGQKLATAEANGSLTRFTIRAPISGIITAKDAIPGEFTDSEQELFALVNLDFVWIDLLVPESDRDKISESTNVTVRTERDPSSAHKGRITYISKIVFPDSQAFLARVVLENKKRSLLPGEFVTATVATTEAVKSLTIRDEAIQFLDSQAIIFQAEGNTFVPRPVVLGAMGAGGLRKIKAGVEEGTSYVSKNSFILKAELLKSLAGHQH